MKFSTLLAKAALLTLVCACSKDPVICESPVRLSDRQHIADPALLNHAPGFTDTLFKYPDLQLAEIYDDEYSTHMYCNVFCNNLKVFNSYYQLSKGKIHPVANEHGSKFLENPGIPATPAISYEQAIGIAKKQINFRHACLGYRLGYYITHPEGTQEKQLMLTWKISSRGGETPYVIVDAINGKVYSADDGIRTF